MSSDLECDKCGEHSSMPYECNYCGGTFCSDHRLPENHNCNLRPSDETVKMFGDSVPGTYDEVVVRGRSASGRWSFIRSLLLTLLIIIVVAIILGIGPLP